MSSANTDLDDERRQYFRIRNSLFIRYEIIEPEIETKRTAPSEPYMAPSIQLLKKLYHLEQNNALFLNSLQPDQSGVSSHLINTNKEIDKIVHFVVNKLDMEYRELVDVDLSGGGIRFESEHSIDINQKLKLEIVLIPEFHHILIDAQVVDCQRDAKDKKFELAITFNHIREVDRDTIIKHVLEIQSKQLRSNKERLASKE